MHLYIFLPSPFRSLRTLPFATLREKQNLIQQNYNQKPNMNTRQMCEIIDTGRCTNCKTITKLSKDSIKTVEIILKTKAEGGFVECAECGHIYLWKPRKKRSQKKEAPYRCPELFCPGYVFVVEEKIGGKKKIPVQMCGECGDIWTSQKMLDEQISRMVAKYPHRKRVYKKDKRGHWVSIHPEKAKVSYEYEEALEEIEMADYDKNQEAIKVAPPKTVFRCTRLACGGSLIPYTPAQYKKRFGKVIRKNRWVCDHCDKICNSLEEIEEAIEGLAEKYPHRKNVYKKVKGHWQPIKLQKKEANKYATDILNREIFDYDETLHNEK